MDADADRGEPQLQPADTIEMPLTAISKIVKSALPNNVQISKEVKTNLARSAGIFVLYLTNTANEICKSQKRSTVTSSDVLAALKEIELEQFIPPLNHFLSEYRKDAIAKKAKAEGRSGVSAAPTATPSRASKRTQPGKASQHQVQIGGADDSPTQSGKRQRTDE